MNIWIVTIGSSDVQLKTNEYWNDWYPSISSSCYKLPFTPTQNIPEADDPYRIAPRVLGMAYKAFSEEIWENLEFPLLKEFTNKLQDKSIDRIFLLLTDQMTEKSQVFDEDDLDTLKHPHWQDTYQLKTILCLYLKQKFPDTPCEVVLLDPLESGKGLDNWDAVLDLVSRKFKDLDIEVSEGEYAYVSHQAGTPALSSAVQFCSLAKFGDRVRFLVSNEYNPELTDFLPSSSYLLGIKREQAKKLLENYDYSGMKEVLKKQIEEANKPKEKPKLEDEILKHISYLLDAAIQWNFAKFEDFAQALSSYSEQNLVKQNQAYLQDVELAQTYLENAERAKAYLQNKDQYWWWTAYESAYLGLIRLEQQNIVEAFFHTFRAMEGLVGFWSADFYPDDIENRNGKIFAKFRNPSKLPQYLFQELEKLHQEDNKDEKGLFGDSLFKLFRESRPDLRDNQDLKTIWKSARGMRNSQFHQLMGFKDEKAMFQAWGMSSRTSWEKRLLNCLNLIANQPQFKSIKDSSLMAQVHQELIKAIVSL